MIPESILRQGAMVTYGWLHFHACKAEQLSYSFPWSYGERASGSYGAIEHPDALRLRAYARRLYAKRNAIGQYLSLHGGRYVPHPMSH
jgi:hypothetical protein